MVYYDQSWVDPTFVDTAACRGARELQARLSPGPSEESAVELLCILADVQMSANFATKF